MTDMQKFSVDTTGFAALTITELLLQECVMKGVLSEKDVKRLLKAAARRHEDAATGNLDRIQMNMETARLIRSLSVGLEPLFKKQRKKKKKAKKKAAQAQISE
ncbi:hypothetical protein GUA87_15480 [Sneathiella sp. P13V-1]|uniref:hypothetical protein n=1 Tax=Sneathiella sp. P13V-1 TaxID=2697366 RepID=UPI00187BB147|nr:hypothetical protein [Sneathiella sp. P13V-1]MBE7638258.1 hypothetical protein [Sneathiella sp. P13V-1]